MQKLNMRFADEQKEFVVKRKVAILMALLAVCLAVPVGVQDWVEMGRDLNGSVYYLNVRSVEDQGNYVTAWVRQDFPADMPATLYQKLYGGTSSYSVTLYGFTKERSQFKMFQIVVCDKNNNVITNTTPDREPSLQQFGFGQWQYCPPGSMIEGIWLFATVVAEIGF